jgi:hypothetical protein
MLTVSTGIVDVVRELRSLADAYHHLSEDDKRAVRSQVYRSTGGFGRLFFKDLDILRKYMEAEVKLLEKKNG